MGWTEFTVAFAAFFLTHAVPVRPPVKPWLVARLGARGFTLAYSLLSAAVLVWLLSAAGRAPYLPLWDWAPWHTRAAILLMIPACIILTLTLGRPNPFSFGGPRTGFDPDHPGLVRVMRHPLLVVLALWAIAHTLANGDLAHVLVFGSFALFAVVGHRLVDRRRRREMGAAWDRLWRDVRKPHAPSFWDFFYSPAIPRWKLALRLMAGMALCVALIEAHPHVIGVPVVP